MGDFYQNGIVTTLHNLTQRPVEELEQELVRFSKTRPLALVLPSLYSELEGPALANIVQELKAVPYLEEIVIGLDRANEEQYRHAMGYFSELPQNVKVLWNDGPRLRGLISNFGNRGWHLPRWVRAQRLVLLRLRIGCGPQPVDRPARLRHPDLLP